MWSAEWRTAATSEREPLRRRIVADIDRLKQIKGEPQRVALYVVRDGYRLIGDKAGEQGVEESLRKSAPVSKIPSEISKGAAQVDAYLKAGEVDKARRVLGEMEKWIDYNKPTLMQQGQYFESRAALAAYEGKKLDAIAFYQRAIAAGRPGALAKARELWKELGGSEEAWLAFIRPVEVRPSWVPGPAWAQKDKPLPAMEVKDLRGQTWTLANLKGKTTLINVWATWCPPCRAELPYVQKMYDRLKDNTEVQVLTFNVDHETELVQPFLKDNKYSFPVLLASSLLDPTLSIPRNWIVDKDAILREEASGFGSDGEPWMQATLAKLLSGPHP